MTQDTTRLYLRANEITKSVWQIADTTKPLAGVIAMVKAGNRVVFDEEDGENVSHIHNKKAEVTIPIEEVGNQYEFDMFLPVKKGTKMQDAMVIDKTEGEVIGYSGVWEELKEEKTNEEVSMDMSEFFLGLV